MPRKAKLVRETKPSVRETKPSVRKAKPVVRKVKKPIKQKQKQKQNVNIRIGGAGTSGGAKPHAEQSLRQERPIINVSSSSSAPSAYPNYGLQNGVAYVSNLAFEEFKRELAKKSSGVPETPAAHEAAEMRLAHAGMLSKLLAEGDDMRVQNRLLASKVSGLEGEMIDNKNTLDDYYKGEMARQRDENMNAIRDAKSSGVMHGIKILYDNLEARRREEARPADEDEDLENMSTSERLALEARPMRVSEMLARFPDRPAPADGTLPAEEDEEKVEGGQQESKSGEPADSIMSSMAASASKMNQLLDPRAFVMAPHAQRGLRQTAPEGRFRPNEPTVVWDEAGTMEEQQDPRASEGLWNPGQDVRQSNEKRMQRHGDAVVRLKDTAPERWSKATIVKEARNLGIRVSGEPPNYELLRQKIAEEVGAIKWLYE